MHPRLAALLQVHGTYPVLHRHHEIERHRVGAGSVALERIPHLGDFPLQGHLRKLAAFGDIEFQAVPGRLHVLARWQLLRQRRDVDARVGTCLERVAIPGRCRRPTVALFPVLRAWTRNGGLVPRMMRAQGRAHGIGLEFVVVPLLVIRVLNELFHPDVQVAQVGCHQLAVDDGTGRRPAMLTPVVGIGVGGVVVVLVIPLAEVDHGGGQFAAMFVVRIAGIHEVVNIVPDADTFLAVIKKRTQLNVELAERRRGECRGNTARDYRLRVRILAAQENVGFTRNAGQLQRFEIEFSGQRVEIGHDLANGFVTVQVSVFRRCGGRRLPHLGVGVAHQSLGEIGAGQHEQMQRVVVQIFAAQQQIAYQDTHRRRLDSQRHF